MSGFLWRVVIGFVLAFVVFAGAYLHGGKEGPCWFGTSFASQFDSQTTDFRVTKRAFPPGQGCEAVVFDKRPAWAQVPPVDQPDGTILGSVMYPRPFEWLFVGIAAVTPFVVRWLYRAVRPRRRGVEARS